MCHLERTSQQTQAQRNDQSHHCCLSLLLSSELILSTKAGAVDTEETVLISFGPWSLGVSSFFLPTLPPSETCFTDFFFFPWGFVSQVHLFWKGWHCLNGLVLLFSVRGCSIIIGVPNREWPNGISVVPTRCCVSRKVYCIIFVMFSPTKISARSCSHVILMCEIRSQELADSPWD